jgi:hypothetical protein
MEGSKLFELMQRAYVKSPALYIRDGFKYKMSTFTFNILLEDCQKHTNVKLNNVTSFCGIPIELDDMMPDYTFHLHGREQLGE